MGFWFKRKESVQEGVKRLASERIDSALRSLKDHPEADAVHGVRKDIKKVRAVLRLARERIPKKVYRRQTELLRKAADQLAPTRDAFVKGAALGDLREHFRGRIGRRDFRPLRKEFERDLFQAKKRFEKSKTARKVKRLLKRIPKELNLLSFEIKGWKAISPGIENAFARARQTYLLARTQSNSERLHDWRKRVKDLWYQVRVLRPIDPKQLDWLAAELKTLSELLGDAHDLVLLQQSFARRGADQAKAIEPGPLTGLILHRRSELQTEALKAGKQLFAEMPAEFCGRLSRYWEAWRAGKGLKGAETHSTDSKTMLRFRIQAAEPNR